MVTGYCFQMSFEVLENEIRFTGIGNTHFASILLHPDKSSVLAFEITEFVMVKYFSE